ncbi:uncharacterized protein LOC127241109 [Andrographis paniculata]|uniref:uncharacterized protein LOC127241109 n=1 Tax=Andrographis paniculata TaxID=175694 RepID=UPI0021E8D032|nr:uncharacterized protein LOC127241109 [Andrographis paniculata]
MHSGVAELKATMAEFKTIKADVYAFMYRNSVAVSGPSATTRIDTVSELLRPVSKSPMTVGTRVLILSRTREKKLVAKGLLLSPPYQVTHFPWSRFSLHPPQSWTHPLFCRKLLGRLPFARLSVKILLSGTIRISCATPEGYRPVPLCFASVCIINCMSWMFLDGRF